MVAFYGVLQIIVTDGGKQPLMRPGYYYRANLKFKQHMVYQVFVSIAKKQLSNLS